MSRELTRAGVSEGVLPEWTSVLAVVAHPDDESFGLGAILDAFTRAGARVEVLCLTHGEASTLHGAAGELASVREAELDVAAGLLGVDHTTLLHFPDGDLGAVGDSRLAEDVVAAAESCGADGLVVFDSAGVTGHPDHVAATSAALAAAEVLHLPVLAWTLPEAVSAQLNQELGTSFAGHRDEEIDLRVSVDRARQLLASRAHVSQALPDSVLWRRLELLADTESLRWLRSPIETEPVETEPVETEPVDTEPVDSEPVDTEAVETEPVDTEAVAGQAEYWAATFEANPDMYGTDPSAPGVAAAQTFRAAGSSSVLELGAGQGRDTLFLARQGLRVTALDYALGTIETLSAKAQAAGLADLVSVARHDVRQPLPLPSSSIDASYSHMLFSMALTTVELEHLVGELRRVLRPGGLVVYTARTTADAHYRTGTPRGDDRYEHGGFIVHFFSQALIERLAAGFEVIDVSEFTEGALPRRLARVTMRVASQ